MYILIGILIVIIFILTGILWRWQRQVEDICRQLAFLKDHESNMLMAGDFTGGLLKLTDLLNNLLLGQREARREFQKKERMIANTYTNLSHDIRTPLTSLDGYFQLLEESGDLEEQKRYLSIIQERITSLKEMLEELFTFTQLKNEAYPLALSACCLNRIIKSTVFSYYEEWEKRGIEPEIAIAEEEFFIEGNPSALRRVVQNVIKNGLEHGEKSIKILLAREQWEIVLRIGNRTAHPEEIDVSQVFTRFYKADAARSKTSAGLGLAIAQELVLRMGGRIEAHLAGDEFWIVISFAANARQTRDSSEQAKNALPGAADKCPPEIKTE